MATHTFRAMHGEVDDSNGADEAFAGHWGPVGRTRIPGGPLLRGSVSSPSGVTHLTFTRERG
ncbi:hypothetical protein GCM10022223_52160 [Kineosporia mesophila]|uniref:Uncharacterized protein n=1 Tax=Kineosporia mesophila TaxID=566012 RepID=A0ABP7AAL5_9ACTN|nr:hypothetical protein [Kineosporia mesophila]MCD5351394.1 hypothetical protein [Kineosporia mesophila]